jgi:hypothetical protein
MGLGDLFNTAATPPPNRDGDKLTDAVKLFLTGSKGSASDPEIIRVSGLYNLCPREAVFQYWRKKINKVFTADSQMKMELGTAAHHHLQNYVFGPMGILWGTWQKLRKDGTKLYKLVGDHHAGEPDVVPDVVVGFHPDPDNPEEWLFVEETFWDEKYRISGHCDGRISLARLEYFLKNQIGFKRNQSEFLKEVLTVDPGEMVLLEMKTCATHFFEELVAGKAEIQEYYQQQASMYMNFTGLKKCYFLYIERKDLQMFGKVYKFDEGWVKDGHRKAKRVWNSIALKQFPDGCCTSKSDKRAKNCVHKWDCFDPLFDEKAFIERSIELAAKEGRQLLTISPIKD